MFCTIGTFKISTGLLFHLFGPKAKIFNFLMSKNKMNKCQGKIRTFDFSPSSKIYIFVATKSIDRCSLRESGRKWPDFTLPGARGRIGKRHLLGAA